MTKQLLVFKSLLGCSYIEIGAVCRALAALGCKTTPSPIIGGLWELEVKTTKHLQWDQSLFVSRRQVGDDKILNVGVGCVLEHLP